MSGTDVVPTPAVEGEFMTAREGMWEDVAAVKRALYESEVQRMREQAEFDARMRTVSTIISISGLFR